MYNKILIKYIFCFLMLMVYSSCDKGKGEVENSCILVARSEKVRYVLDSNTTHLIKALYLFTDDGGKDYVTFQNDKEPEILFYDFETSEMAFKLELEYEGSNGVGMFLGYYIKNRNEIYLTSLNKKEIIIVDSNGIIRSKIDYGKMAGDIPVTSYQSITFASRTLIIEDDKLIISQVPNRSFNKKEILEKSPLALTIDLKKDTLIPSSFKFPPIIKSDDYANLLPV